MRLSGLLVLTVLAGVLALGLARAGDDPEPTDWERLRDAASVYVVTHSDAKAQATWAKKWSGRISDRMESAKLTEDAAAQALVLDWRVDREADLKDKKPATILEACRIFVWLHANKIELPGLVRDGLQQEERMLRFAEWLQTESRIAQAAKPD